MLYTTNCPNSFCYTFEDKPHFEAKKKRKEKDKFPIFLYAMMLLGFIALCMFCISFVGCNADSDDVIKTKNALDGGTRQMKEELRIEQDIVEYINKEIENDGQVLFSYKIDKMNNNGEFDSDFYIMETITYNWSNEPVVNTLLVLYDKSGKIEYKTIGE